MAKARLAALTSQWAELAPTFLQARQALYATKDRDDISSNELDEAANEVEEYSKCMSEAKRTFKIIRMTINNINPEDENTPAVLDIMEKFKTYLELYKLLSRNFCKAHTFKRNRVKAAEEREKLRLEELQEREKFRLEEMKEKEKLKLEEMNNAKEIMIKKLELEASNTSLHSESSTPGTSTPVSRSSPVPPPTQLPARDTSQFKPKMTLSSDITFMEMVDWKQETLAWFKAANFPALDLTLQRQLLRQVVEEESWVRGHYTFEDGDSHTAMIDKLCAEFKQSLPLFNHSSSSTSREGRANHCTC